MALVSNPVAAIIHPEWNVRPAVQAASTCRYGGVSTGGYQSLNLATHVDDDPQQVGINRQRLITMLNLPQEPRWLAQVHSPTVVCADIVGLDSGAQIEADGTWTDQPGTVCAILTADCLPILLCDKAGTVVAAVHAGWRGLSLGIIDQILAVFMEKGIAADQIVAWLGPAIGPAAYEVDAVVRDAILQFEPACRESFMENRSRHWQFDLCAASSAILRARGVADISGGGYCTYSEQRFYSYRRNPLCGRQATLIWLEP